MEIKVNIETVEIQKIFPNVWNPNKQTDFMFDKEMGSIKAHGFVQPILVREIPEGFEIIDGEHRWRASQQLGFTHVPVNNLGKVTESVAKQLTVMMNEIKGKAESARLGELMQELKTEIGEPLLIELMPFSEEEIKSMIHKVEIDWNNLSPKQSEPKNNSDDDWRTVSLRLPEGVADQLESQILRFKKVLHPNDDPYMVNPVMAIEAMVQHLAQIPEDQLI